MAEARSFHRGPGYLIFHSIGPGSPEHSQRHLHDEYVISCQLRGGELREFSREVTRVEPGDIVTINPQQVHSSRALDPAECTETREFLNLRQKSPELEIEDALEHWQNCDDEDPSGDKNP